MGAGGLWGGRGSACEGPAEGRNGIITHARDLGGMVDEVHGGVGVVAESYFLVHEYLIGEGVEDLCLLVLVRVGLGGVLGAAEGVVLFQAPMARLEGRGEGCDGEGEEGEEGCEMHGGWIGGGDGRLDLWMQGSAFGREQRSEVLV